MERFSTTVANKEIEREPDAIVRLAYDHYVREPLKTYAPQGPATAPKGGQF
jgi:hypothetical protein